ncbi:X-linked retinitis pigmentosa GTPase regulator-like isoform X2 [Prorops nasuta]|uniref:X-linked retinitis pigmentosa GTPase regulator-like isoform X2 n=1 Tax=Prorops nasuta TaxID=863751 RepID=UPI0034CFCB3C
MGLPDIENIPETGAVFTIGRSRFADNVASHFFIRKDPVVNINCGDEHSAVICQTGRLFVFGSNDWGQLGLGHKNHVSKPSCVKILKPEKVTHVACGRAHTLICTGAQKIFACGSDQEGQLGRGAGAIGDSSSVPVLVYDSGLVGPKVMDVVAGSHHSMALTSDGGVVAWGSNLEGQLGLSGISGLVNKPTKVPIPEPVKEISAGYYHSAFLTQSGLVYVCGESESGKLGIDVSFSTQVAPKQMQLPCPAAHVACGGHHTLILGENGSVYCVGSNASGQLGMGTSVTEIQTAKLVPQGSLRDEPIVKIAAGESHSALLTASGKLFTCGDGRHGKLALEENENNVHELTYAAKYEELFISNVSCGGCHTILIGRRRVATVDHDQEEPQAERTVTVTTTTTDQPSQKKQNPLPPLKLPLNRLQSKEKIQRETEENEPMRSEKINLQEESEKGKEAAREKVEEETSSETTTQNGQLTNSSDPAIQENPKDTADFVITSMQSDDALKKEKDEAGVDLEKSVKDKYEESPIVHATDAAVAAATTATTATSAAAEENNLGEQVDENIVKEITTAVSVDKIATESEKTTLEELSEVTEETNFVAPAKPPRQKLGSLETTEEATSDAAENRPEASMSPSNIGGDKTIKNQEESPAKISMVSEKSHSTKSKADTDETIQAETENVRNNVNEMPMEREVAKEEVDNIDDADVVQSPAPRTSKMAKLFKTRRQNVENGTKSSHNTTSTKAKSKTCSIL